MSGAFVLAQGQQHTELNGVGSFVIVLAALLVVAALFGRKK
jgi:hypothetical protein